ncbi:MAG: DOMON-like domain-containing protein [Cyanobacteriota bacterium]|jgi:hypothetical protein
MSDRTPASDDHSRPVPASGEHSKPLGEKRAFALRPFATSAEALGLRLGGHLARQGDRLRVVYQLRGDLDPVTLAAPADGPPERADNLWEHTCFELFLAAEGEAPYWEVNLSPSGAWNLYRLDGYRQGLRPEPDRDTLPFAVSRSPGLVEVRLDLSLPAELARTCRQRPLWLGVTAVIERRGGELSYWALAHGGAEADFHRREDFLMRLRG